MSEDLIAKLSAQLPPYAQAMGMRVDHLAHGAPVLTMDYASRTVGRPGFLHGGAIAGMLEIAAIAALRVHLGDSVGAVRLKPINISVEYLRGGVEAQTFAVAQVIRAGRRIANVRAEAWQADREKPLASCWMNFLLKAKA